MTHTPNPWRCPQCGYANPGDNACCDECGWDGFTTAAQREKEYPNGNPMFAPDGTMLDENGNRSIFDDVDD